jgi:peptidoglycan/LPS O-acetylase OafA/YrhL
MGRGIEKRNGALFAVDTSHVGILDGMRAIGVLGVLWFHFWQQTWLMPIYRTPFLSWAGIDRINPDVLRRCGYLFVDLMLLISAFVLYLPHARSVFCGTDPESTKTFFKKRFARIVPSYLLAIVITFIVALIEGKYAGKPGFAAKDLLTHLTFTSMAFNDTYLFTCTNGVLWTVCIEVCFYLIFPLLAKGFRKRPIITYLSMMIAGLVFTYAIAPHIGEPRVMVNRFLTFLPVFANGMMAAHLYVWYASRIQKKAIPSVVGTAVSFAAVWLLIVLFKACAHSGNQQIWQMQNRVVLSFVFTAWILGTAISLKPVRRLYDNRVLASIAAVSYNLYIWHQWIMVHLREAFGAKNGGDIAKAGAETQWTLTIIGLLAVLFAAILVTYGFEQPLSRLIMRRKKEKEHAYLSESQ